MVNIAVGEMGLSYRGKDYLLRPSFYAINQIDDPEGIIEIYNELSKGEINPYSLRLSQMILQCCCDQDIGLITGYPTESRAINHIMGIGGHKIPTKVIVDLVGKMEDAQVIILATRLLFLGIHGDPKRRTPTNFAPLQSFDTTEFVGAAVAHLGVTLQEAWHMTMIEFQRAFEAKFPGDNVPTKKELKPQFERAGKVCSILDAKKRRPVSELLRGKT